MKIVVLFWEQREGQERETISAVVAMLFISGTVFTGEMRATEDVMSYTAQNY